MDNNHAWKFFRTFQSTEVTQKYLNECYKEYTSPEAISYKNCYSFIYHLQHGEKYFQQSVVAPYELQPILLFYGTIQLMKASILTVDPYYPESTQVLAHGVTTRKRKRIGYSFLQDEVKVQKNGLFSHFSDKMFHMKQIEGNKYKIEELLKKVPEIHYLFKYINKDVDSYQLKSCGSHQYFVSNKILDHLHLTKDSFQRLLENFFCIEELNEGSSNAANLYLKFKKPLNPLITSPLFYNLKDHTFHLPINRNHYYFFPEILVHYLILYSLSMVCRYETEWWGELFHNYSSTDLPYIKEFLDITKAKIPFYIQLILQSKIK